VKQHFEPIRRLPVDEQPAHSAQTFPRFGRQAADPLGSLFDVLYLKQDQLPLREIVFNDFFFDLAGKARNKIVFHESSSARGPSRTHPLNGVAEGRSVD